VGLFNASHLEVGVQGQTEDMNGLFVVRAYRIPTMLTESI
jgi:hypothetical protein